MEIKKCICGYQRCAKVKTFTNRGIQNPRRRKDRYAWIALETDMLAITAIERPENLRVSAKIRMPSIMNPINLPDMGSMNGNWALEGKIGYLQGPIPVRKPWPAP